MSLLIFPAFFFRRVRCISCSFPSHRVLRALQQSLHPELTPLIPARHTDSRPSHFRLPERRLSSSRRGGLYTSSNLLPSSHTDSKLILLQDLRTRLVVFDHVMINGRHHRSPMTMHDLLGSQERVHLVILSLSTPHCDNNCCKIGTSEPQQGKDVFDSSLDQALSSTSTLIKS